MASPAINTAALLGLDKPILARAVSFSVSFPRTPDFDLRLTKANLVQRPEAHDVLELQFRGQIDSATKKILNNDPVVFTYMSPGKTKTWVGYIHHVSPLTTSAQSSFKVVAVSASYVLKESAQKVYTNVTADQVVSRIAQANGLAAITQRHPRVHSTISNTGLSMWQLLTRLARQSGFGLVVDGTTLRFQSKDQFFTDSLAKGLYFKSNASGVPANNQYASIQKFSPIISDNAPEMQGARVERVIGGVATGTTTPINTRHKASSAGRSSGRGVKGATE
jgi:hypothetical protein